ncbi:DNA helicase RecD, partial [Streptomyces sp. ZL-24]
MTALPGETPGTAGTDTPEGDAPTEATDAEAPAHTEAPDATDAEATEAGASAAETGEVAEASADEATGSAEATEGAGDTAGASAGGEEDAAAPALSEAQAELAAQRELRERIAQRKAAKDGPVAAGTKLSGTAADLLAAVRAVESGQKTGTEFFDSHLGTPTPRRAAPAPAVQPRRPDPAAAPVERPAASPEAVDAVRAVLTEGGAPEALARPA